MVLCSLNRLGLYEALCGSAQGFIQDVVFRVLSARTKYKTKMTARALHVVTGRRTTTTTTMTESE